LRRFRLPEMVLGFLISTVLWVTVAIIYPKYYDAEAEATKSAPQVATETSVNERIANYSEALDWLTAFLVAANIALWWTTWRGSVRQSRDMRATLDHARESLTAIERAFVAISDTGVSTISIRGVIADYRIHINVTNSGRTPARNYCARVNLAVFDQIPENFRFPDRPIEDQTARNVIGPQSRTYLQIDLFIQDAVALHQKRKRALIYGWLEYEDIFPGSPKRRTEFCLEPEVFADPREIPQIIRAGSMEIPILILRPYGGRYNGYDDDCLYRPGETPVAADGELPPLTPPPENPPVNPGPKITYTLG
jgi:hypothetical protein